MTVIRRGRDADSERIGWLIADTYAKFNLSWVAPGKRARFLGPFGHARSREEPHLEAIAAAVRADILLVAEDGAEIVGVLRGNSGQLQSLFVREDYQRQGIGRRLVEGFEAQCVEHGSTEVKVRATLYGVPFYHALGYRRTTGIRSMRSFEGTGLPYQPMRKRLGHE